VQVFTNAGRETFGDCFLGRPASRVMFVRIFQSAAVSLLLCRKDPFEKAIAVFREHELDALNIDQIAAKSDQSAAWRKNEAHENLTTEHTENTELEQSQLFSVFSRVVARRVPARLGGIFKLRLSF
jgi:hypothetical protein